MSERVSKLKITQDIVKKTNAKVEPFADNMAGYARSVMLRMGHEQPRLTRFIATARELPWVHDPLVYELGAALTYNMLVLSLPEEERTKKISERVLTNVVQNLREHIDSPEQTSGTHTGDRPAILDLTSFSAQLEDDSQAFTDWLGKKVEALESDAAKFDFTFGTVLVAMPFFIMREIEELEREFSR